MHARCFYSRLLPVLALLITGRLATADTAALPYPEIPVLSATNPVFAQYSDDVSAAREELASGKTGDALPLSLYAYRASSKDSLLGIAARCSIPYDAIASLNRIASMNEPIAGKMLVLPTLPGLYLPDISSSPLETLLLSSFDPADDSIISFTLYMPDGGKRAVHCIPDLLFNGTVRAFFLSPSFIFPLAGSMVTSTFGMRKNPVTGNLVFHKGIDLAAPAGTPVRACAPGTVKDTGYDPVYGNYVILLHSGNRESLYGHLSSIKIELRQSVKSGTILGTVGSTGQSTGPHLHFEIHENGVPKNPTGFIKGN
ncbi:MAG TPA: LysM peptidoglycan-binding domain-containing M23 family metallopeptidase [Treponemataceae bacterium]|jgi:hypothetical protein|nr:MAG: Murein DD-endopeptidase MepM [Spirochaetes bacterium ADurb.Bin269]TAH47951.1 MAG: M23 family peptidase [Treponema sp.]HOC29290.1 LysM peptidoglycan-binding domain-containing M23 family metallopeptidase [Treponemataceae bacterium]HQL32463.1 LysM peptidoglycan-binding domain-containing M23 family metallopeptidase [Treponemataceae bacterium]